MIKKIFIFFTSLSILGISITSAQAVSPSPSPAPTSGSIQPVGQEVTQETLDAINPLKLYGKSAVNNIFFNANGSVNLGGIINRLLTFIFPLAGILLFIMITWGGFEMLTGTMNKKSTDAGQQRVTAAVVGFLLLFVSYWIIQMVEFITGVNIFGT